jgi:hypothetical protein
MTHKHNTVSIESAFHGISLARGMMDGYGAIQCSGEFFAGKPWGLPGANACDGICRANAATSIPCSVSAQGGWCFQP